LDDVPMKYFARIAFAITEAVFESRTSNLSETKDENLKRASVGESENTIKFVK
jgi:hypothetical protein